MKGWRGEAEPYPKLGEGGAAGPEIDLVFFGTPDFAATILGALVAAGHRVLAVYTQPPRPAGRGHRVQRSAVQLWAEAHGLDVRSPAGLREPEVQAEFAALGADAAVVAAYGLILPPTILAAPRLGCLNVHASLLPRWRGAAPVQRALLAGDAETGVTIMQMDAGLDTGPILLQQPLPIPADADAGTLTAALAELGGILAVAALERRVRGDLAPQRQPKEGVTYAAKIRGEEARLDWRLAAGDLERRVRAFHPQPGAYFEHRGERIRVLAAAACSEPISAAPGTVLDEALAVACGAGALRPLRLQRPGRTALSAAEFLRGFAIPAGMVLPCPAGG